MDYKFETIDQEFEPLSVVCVNCKRRVIVSPGTVMPYIKCGECGNIITLPKEEFMENQSKKELDLKLKIVTTITKINYLITMIGNSEKRNMNLETISIIEKLLSDLSGMTGQDFITNCKEHLDSETFKKLTS